MKEGDHLITLCVYSRQIWSCMSVASEASEAKIVHLIRAAMLPSTDMVNHMRNKQKVRLL
jgi:hypothetical protein